MHNEKETKTNGVQYGWSFDWDLLQPLSRGGHCREGVIREFYYI